jgi:3-oxoacyl-[acyl-carrier-protein] synthase III
MRPSNLKNYADANSFAHAGTCILFGDGAGAAVLSAKADGASSLLGSDMRSDGQGYCHLNAPLDSKQAGKAQNSEKRSKLTAFDNIFMNGQDVYKFAVRAVPDTLNASLKDAGLNSSDIDWLVMHQANKRILDAAAKKLGIASEKVRG